MFEYFSKNGEVLPITEAHVPIQNIEYSYGFGVYETIRVSKGIVYFLDDHIERLINSALIIGLEHTYDIEQVKGYVKALVSKITTETYNLKVQLIGAPSKEKVLLTIYPSNPMFPDRKMYHKGVKVITEEYTRLLPNAKSLNMLGSYLAYRKAGKSDCYETLLVNTDGKITEGTRSNFFFLKGGVLYTAKKEDVLEGVTRKVVMLVAEKCGVRVVEKDIFMNELESFDSVFLTNTSSKIMPVRKINEKEFAVNDIILTLIKTFGDFLKESGGVLEK